MFEVTERELPPAGPLLKFINLPPCLIHSSGKIAKRLSLRFIFFFTFRRVCRLDFPTNHRAVWTLHHDATDGFTLHLHVYVYNVDICMYTLKYKNKKNKKHHSEKLDQSNGSGCKNAFPSITISMWNVCNSCLVSEGQGCTFFLQQNIWRWQLVAARHHQHHADGLQRLRLLRDAHERHIPGRLRKKDSP